MNGGAPLLGCDTPFGRVSTWIDDVTDAPVVLETGGTTTWSTDRYEVAVTCAAPRYDGVVFEVEGHMAWLWRVTVSRPTDRLRIVTRLSPLPTAADLRHAPVTESWTIGVMWNDANHVAALGTSSREALAIRRADGMWLPERYLADTDPTTAATVPFIERNAVGIVATFADARPGECFAHHVALAWADPSRTTDVLDAVEVDDDGILRGADTAGSTARRAPAT